MLLGDVKILNGSLRENLIEKMGYTTVAEVLKDTASLSLLDTRRLCELDKRDLLRVLLRLRVVSEGEFKALHDYLTLGALTREDAVTLNELQDRCSHYSKKFQYAD